MIDLDTMTWTCMVCGAERPDQQIKVAHRRIPGMEDLFPQGRVNVRYCADRPGCARVDGYTGVWPETIDTEALGKLMLRVEADAHRIGWDDAPPRLFILHHGDATETAAEYRSFMRGNHADPHRSHGGIPVRVGPYVAQPMTQLGAAAGISTADALRNIAMNLAYACEDPRAATMLEVVQRPGVFGMAICVEAWGNSDTESDRDPGVRLADVVGSYELRQAIAATLDGHLTVALRRRGEKPQAASDVDFGGYMINSLKIICDAIRGDVPPPEKFEERYPPWTSATPEPGPPADAKTSSS